MAGRGAWNAQGVGGTKGYKSDRPGPYYYLGTGKGRPSDNNERAVKQAVKVYQRALRGAGYKSVVVDGVFGPATFDAVWDFQKYDVPNTTPWGGIGPDTSEYLLKRSLRRVVSNNTDLIPYKIVSGLIRTESMWDVGAVGYLDDRDVGLAQINADAHPTWSFAERIRPKYNFKFIVDYLEYTTRSLDDNLDHGIAAYNLGVGGARTWIRAGAPNRYRPPGSTVDRFVWDYINKIKAG